VLKILECQEYILANKNDNTYSESIRLARKWIEEVWDIDDKQFLEDFVSTYKEQDLAEYLALSDLPPDDFDIEKPDEFVQKFKERDDGLYNEFEDFDFA
jgi:Uma2 family endonuclease